MSKKHLTLADLKLSGLKLSKYEAQELHHHINRISQHGGDEPEEVFAPSLDEPEEGESKSENTKPPAIEHHATKKKRQKEQGLMDHVVSQEDLDNNPELAAEGVKVGDTIEIPIQAD